MWLLLTLTLARADDPALRDELARRDLPPVVVEALLTRVRLRAAELDPQVPLVRLVTENLADKRLTGDLAGRPFPLTVDDIGRRVIDYEALKAQAYLGSGVFPKRYFGYLDGKWDTAARERTLRETVHGAVETANIWLAEEGVEVRLTDQAVAVTFIAEGGALMLDAPGVRLDRLDPIMDVGLDSLAYGLRAWSALATRLDEALGTGLAETVAWEGDGWRIVRYFDFRDAIAGTAFMMVYEEALLDGKLREAGRRPLAARPLDEQYVLTSLHYNSGLLFSEGRVAMLRGFQTAAYLDDVSRRTYPRRSLLPVLAPDRAAQELALTGAYPEQMTSWNAVYHVLQRYGAWTALRRCTDWFDEAGAFTAD